MAGGPFLPGVSGSKAALLGDYTAQSLSTSNISGGKAARDGQSSRHRTAMSLRFAPLARLCLFPLVLPACNRDKAAPEPVVATGDQVVAVVADERGFTPAAVQAQRGSKLTLRFTRTTNDTCADKVVFPEAGIEQDLPLKQPVDILVPTSQARTLGFQCGMGMFKSSVLIR
jgi:Cupredoxin-like domain